MKKFLLLCFSFVFVTSMVLAQERVVSGRVTASEDGAPLPGVNVLLRGTTNGTVTDTEGNFKLSVPATGATLVFSFIGFATQEVAVGDQAVVDIQLASDVKQLGEVVVTALGVQREQKSLGYSVSKIDNQQLTAARTTNISNALTGKIAGLRVQGSNGMVGSSSSILIRGQTTFTGSNQPLFVVDGIPIDNSGGINALQSGVSNSNRAIDLNQDDIASVSVLKGPSAAVLYGSRAAAGAILITTKKGSANAKNTVQFTTGITVSEVNKYPEYQNIYGQGQYGVFNPVNEVNSWGPKMSGQNVTNFRGQQEALTARPNNVRDLFNRGTSYQNNISLSGGNGKGSAYYVSYGNLHEFGILPSNELLRNSVTFNGSTAFTDKFRSSINVIYTNTASSRTQQGNQRSNPFFSGWITPRSFDWYRYPYVNPDGTQKTPLSATDLTTQNTAFGLDDNPFFTEQYNTYNDQVNRIIGNISLSYDITPWLTAMYRLGTDTYSQQFKVINAKTAKGGSAANQTGSIRDEIYNREEISSYFTMTVTKRFSNDDFGLRALIGNEINSRSDRDNGVTGTDIQVIGLNNITNTLNFNPFGTVSQQRLVGVFADISLDYKNSVYLGLTGRNDWSSTYSRANNSYFYPAITTSVLLTEVIPALQDSRILSFAKIRANYASVGREAPVYSTDTYFGRSGPADGFGPSLLYPFRGQLGQTLSNTGGAPDLKPEFNDNWEVGMDLRFLNGRITFDVNYFNNTSRDVIFNVPVASTSGFTSQTKNIGKTESKGWELEINANPVNISGFRWDINFNWTQIDTKVLSLAPGVTQVTLGGFVTPSTRLIVGQPYGVIFGSVMQRDPASGKLLVDANGRLQTALDNKIIGNPNPKWYGGFTNTFSYKGITLSALMDFRWGGDLYSRNISDVKNNGAAIETADREVGYIHDGVLADGTKNNIQIHAQDYFKDLYGFGRGEFVVVDGSWIRLREVSITYQLPQSLFEKTFIGKLEVGLNGRNLWLSAPNVPHIDPEINAQGQSNSQGLEFNGLPQTRTFGALIKMTF
ncbi:MAG: SusC/RagA family TonB-linked outer membrane protein [Cyclobacteriaceae bacterium]|nr:SusC/RagA family TonB-linked outer membrane protein [Cyclobacteriaceae bacterium]